MPARPVLPYGRHCIEADDIAAVVDVLEHGQLTSGPEIEDFERDLAAAVDAPYAVSCANATAALHLALAALDVGPAARVVVPSVTFLATANAARYVGAEVVFADVDPDTGLMRPQDLQNALDRSAGNFPAAVIPVHLNGQVCDLPAIREIADANGLAVVEDACHAIGGSVSSPGGPPQPVGSAHKSAAACFSFHAVKTVAMGEGGAVTTRSAALAEKIRLLRSHGMDRQPKAPLMPQQGLDENGLPNPWYYEMAEPGWNYRLTGLQAALGRSQLRRLPAFIAARQKLVGLYDAALKILAPYIRPIAREPHQNIGWHLYVVLIDFCALGRSRAAVMRALAGQGVGTQVHYLPVHRQPYYVARYGARTLPGADTYYEKCLTLPLFPGMTEEDVTHVVASLEKATGIG